MGNRLTKIFTRKGDDGSTDTGSNERVPKYDQQIKVFGSLDELNASTVSYTHLRAHET